ncbi:MAG: hypothetical protein WC551_02625 [Patescibacteria group bacterium]
MKVLKGKVEIEQTDGATRYIYPDFWMSVVSRLPAVLYPNTRGEEIEEGGKKFQPVFVFVPDELVDEMKEKCGLVDAEKAEFEDFSDKHYPEKPRVTDVEKVLLIVSKTASGKKLTKDDEDALNPESPVPGIEKIGGYKKIAQAYGVNWK